MALSKQEIAFQRDAFRFLCHELRRPVASIQAYTELLIDKSSGPLTPEQNHDVETILRNTHRLSRLIQNLSDWGKVQLNELRVASNAVDVEAVFSQACHDLEPFRIKKIWVHYEVCKDVPEIWGNYSRLLQVMENLLEHALQFTPENGEVAIKASSRDGKILIEVKDSGPSLNSRGLDKIAFSDETPDSSAEQLSRAGELIGLALSRQVVRRLGGKFWAEDLGESGVRFCLEMEAVENSVGSRS